MASLFVLLRNWRDALTLVSRNGSDDEGYGALKVLPREIRQQIYQYALADHVALTRDSIAPRKPKATNSLSLLRASKAINKEAQKCLYPLSTFTYSYHLMYEPSIQSSHTFHRSPTNVRIAPQYTRHQHHNNGEPAPLYVKYYEYRSIEIDRVMNIELDITISTLDLAHMTNDMSVGYGLRPGFWLGRFAPFMGTKVPRKLCTINMSTGPDTNFQHLILFTMNTTLGIFMKDLVGFNTLVLDLKRSDRRNPLEFTETLTQQKMAFLPGKVQTLSKSIARIGRHFEPFWGPCVNVDADFKETTMAFEYHGALTFRPLEHQRKVETEEWTHGTAQKRRSEERRELREKRGQTMF
ncbi:uncharacterized protein KY384_006298 [Bacidia gigantensis]|uniref:uncharacterized protein n=1 Tax=Bacidia gigantensis TaxID=2732470 RepID=UPI001D03E5BF|nr:uncharacterized protein KY384_006298 [Bacidia gigantensis]KAG8528611.1 hypothetical protein KY384_006298 [Bacidia gigantensis]